MSSSTSATGSSSVPSMQQVSLPSPALLANGRKTSRPAASAALPPQYEEDLAGRMQDFINSTSRPPRAPAYTQEASSAVSIHSSQGSTVVDCDAPPAFGEKQNPNSVPRYFFYFGFLCPIFWFLGASVLLWKLRPADDLEAGKLSPVESDKLMLLRDSEEKWAYRCLVGVVVCLIVSGVVVIVIATHH